MKQSCFIRTVSYSLITELLQNVCVSFSLSNNRITMCSVMRWPIHTWTTLTLTLISSSRKSFNFNFTGVVNECS